MKSWGGWVLLQDWVNCPKFTRFSMASLNHDQIVQSNHIFISLYLWGSTFLMFNSPETWWKFLSLRNFSRRFGHHFRVQPRLMFAQRGERKWNINALSLPLLTISLYYTAVHPPQETGNAKSNYFCLNFFNCSSWYLLHITLMLLAYRMLEYITETNIESQFVLLEINGQPYYHLHPPLPHPPPPPSPPIIL